MSFTRLWMKYFFIIPLGILWLENVVIQNYNRFKLLIFIKKKNKRVSKHVLTPCLEDSVYISIYLYIYIYIYLYIYRNTRVVFFFFFDKKGVYYLIIYISSYNNKQFKPEGKQFTSPKVFHISYKRCIYKSRTGIIDFQNALLLISLLC